ncbi:OLC1v1003000C1 [Oldenlandia corymbosa var. corymbosa]|uniref:glucan endo-1,3-beta-D-glucosidase n=1 Tax=Oldenlandia corymbosa var. corymbosa TaxID=529605 RepID=A0AAV1D934_OLDCO|nr:OLC1v1003000C1 [Oldenlandia corymbosa var. corymbosa]
MERNRKKRSSMKQEHHQQCGDSPCSEEVKAGPNYYPLRPRRFIHEVSQRFGKVPKGYEVSSDVIKRAKEIEANLDPQFPCFKKIMLRTHLGNAYSLNLPMAFVRKNMPPHEAVCTLEDEDGELWETMFCFGEIHFFRAGWKEFAVDHNLLEGDAVVFQLVAPCKFKAFIVRSTRSGEVDETPKLSQSDENINGKESGKSHSQYISQSDENINGKESGEVREGKGKDSRGHEKSTVFVDLQNFNVIFKGVALDSNFKIDVRHDYYDLCLSQNSYLHVGLLEAISDSFAVDIISDTVKIAKAIKSSNITTPISKFKLWDQALERFEKLGMKVGFLRARASKLMDLAEQVKDTPNVKRYKEALMQYDIEGEEIRTLEAKLWEVQQEREKLHSEIEILKKQVLGEGSKFLEEAYYAPWLHIQRMMKKIKEGDIVLVVQIIFCLLALSNAKAATRIGIVYGGQGNNLPAPNQSVQLLQRMNVDAVRLPDANHEMLHSLSRTRLHVAITVENELIPDIASNQTRADQWVQENVVAYYPEAMVRYIFVGNEVLSQNNTSLWHDLVPALKRIHDAVRNHNIENIKIATPLAMDILETTFPPSRGTFRSDIPQDQVLVPLLKFLDGTNSLLFLNVFPYKAWSANPTNLSLDQALFRVDQSSAYQDPGSSLNYTNLLDQMLDSVLYATEKLGFENIDLGISATGWPHAGDIDQPGANVYNAATYNRNLARKLNSKGSAGTPARPKALIPTFIYSLFDENQKLGPTTERSWGLLRPNGLPTYELDLTGSRSDKEYSELPTPLNNNPYRGNLWCIVVPGVNTSYLSQAIINACSQGNGTCDAIAPGKECYEPVSLISHASYAFSSYWAQFRSRGGACYFDGLAMESTRDLSHGSCKYPSVTV